MNRESDFIQRSCTFVYSSSIKLMWKQVAVVILLFSFAACTFCRAVILLDYYSNTVAYAKNCENKARPQMHCNGKCQMMKKLQQQENEEQNNSERKTESKNEVLSSKSFFGSVLPVIPGTSNRFTAARNENKPIDRSYTLFRPPAVS